jgi:lipopolysaccharide/colanic/teichoic acid biosynthesis glycosyltransferase
LTTGKRLFDVVAAAVGLLLLSPLFLVVALLIKLDSPGPVFYRGWRIGEGGLRFRMIKFRTMVRDAEALGPVVTIGDDVRVTNAGRLLRRTKLDELPQLLNVVAGTMSIVGPRPEDPTFVAHYSPEEKKILELRPGITSPASLAYRREEALLRGANWQNTYLQVILPRKLEIEREYAARRTLFSDLALIARTVFALFSKCRTT